MTPNWRFVMLHHSKTRDSGTVSWNAIRRYHTQTERWSDIGYPWGVELVTDAAGESHYEALMGRSMLVPGAHCYQKDMNRLAIGVCMVGDFDIAPPPRAQIATTIKLVRWLLHTIGRGPDAVIAHRDYAPKTCPGSAFDMNEFRARLRFG